MFNLAFGVITQYLHKLNSNLHGINRLINEIFTKIKASERNLWLWELQLWPSDFPTLWTKKPTDTRKNAEEIQILQQEFSPWFKDLQKQEAAFSLFSAEFDINAENHSRRFSVGYEICSALRIFSDITLLTFSTFSLLVTSLQCSETMHNRWQAFLDVHIVTCLSDYRWV